jgi:hypothetical protein
MNEYNFKPDLEMNQSSNFVMSIPKLIGQISTNRLSGISSTVNLIGDEKLLERHRPVKSDS